MTFVICLDVVGDGKSKLTEQCSLTLVGISTGVSGVLDETLVLRPAFDVVLPPGSELGWLTPVSANVLLIYHSNSG